MNTRFSLFTLLCIPAAFAAGWCLGGRSENQRVEALASQYAQREAEIEQVAHAINAANFINIAYQALDRGSLEKQDRRRTTLLIEAIMFLARAEPFKTERHGDVFLRHASNALELLGASNVEELVRMVELSSLVETAKALFLDRDHAEHETTLDFVRRAFAWRQAQPTYPARLWLEAIAKGDAKLLKAAYSERQQRRNEGTWDELVVRYQTELSEEFEDYSPHDFSFGYTTSFDNQGEVRVLWKQNELRAIDIIQEETGWKLDEL